MEISYTWHAGAGRRAALATPLHRLTGDLGTALAPGGDVAARLRPFLAVRILGVISLAQMSGPQALACLAKLRSSRIPPGTCLLGAPPLRPPVPQS